MNLKGFFGKIGNAFKSVGKLAGSIFVEIFAKSADLSKDEKAIIEQEIDKGTQKTMGLAAIAMNAVNMVDNVVLGDKLPDDVIDSLQKMGTTAEAIWLATSKFIKDGGRLHLAKELLVKELIDMVTNRGQEINLGYRVLRTTSDILNLPDDDLLTTVQHAKNIATRVGEKLKGRSEKNQ